MAIVATKTVTFQGDPASNGDTYEWVATWTGPQNWVTVTETATAGVWEFDAADWIGGQAGTTRSVIFELRHHLAGTYVNDSNLRQSFTITQHADQSGTSTQTTSSTTTTTEAPTTQAPTTQGPSTETTTYTTTWTVNSTVSNATVHVTDSLTSPADNNDTRVAAAGVTVNRVFYFRPAEGYAFQNPSDISVSASQGTATVDSSLTSLGNIKVNVSHVTNTTNNNITVTASGGAQSTSIGYTQLLVTPSAADEGTSITITMNGNNIPNGTEVFVEISGASIQNDFDTESYSSGSGSGTPYGGTGDGFDGGIMLTFNNNTASRTLAISEDQLTEGNETAVFTAYSVDSLGNATGGLSDSAVINDTSTAPSQATVTYSIGGSDQWTACNNTPSPRSVSYQLPSTGLATWTTVRDAIRNDADTLISSGVWYKVISSTEGGFTFGNHVINGGYDTTASALTNCSTVTTTTTTTEAPVCNSYTLNNMSSSYYAVTWSWTDCSGQGQTTTISPGGAPVEICSRTQPYATSSSSGSATVTFNGLCGSGGLGSA